MYILGPEKRDELVEKVTRKFMEALTDSAKLGKRSSKFEQSRYDIYPKGMAKPGHPLNEVIRVRI